MTADVQWWLLVVGVVAGARLCLLVVTELRRRDDEISEAELLAESTWIARTLGEDGRNVDPAVAEQVLRAHRRYLGLPRPDALVDPAAFGEGYVANPDEEVVASWPDERVGTPATEATDETEEPDEPARASVTASTAPSRPTPADHPTS